jgi:hypothetical protein
MSSEERVRELCTELLAAQDDDAAVMRIAPILRQALHEHCERLRKMGLLDFPPPPGSDVATD